MNPVVKAQLAEFQGTNPVQGFKEQDYFEVYSLFAIANGILHESVDPFDLHLKGEEFGLDGVGVLVQGESCSDSDEVDAAMDGKKSLSVEFIFFQAKRSEKFDYGEISKFLDAVYGFFDDTMAGESDQLDDLLEAKKRVYAAPLRKNPVLRCFFATTGSYETVSRIEKLLEASRSRLDDLNLFEKVEIELVGAKSLQAAYRAATNLNAATFEFPKSQTMPDHPSVDQAYVGYVAADQLLALVYDKTSDDQRIDSSVFFDNIRDFDEKSGINKQMLEQLQLGQANAFVFKNNGVTVVANTIIRTGDRFSLENFQVVNGCQTCNILFQAKEHVAGVFVPLRVIGCNDEAFIASIIIGTNKQNEVKDDQFWALKPFMKDLEDFCRQQPEAGKIFLERRENQYRNESVERTRIVKPSDVLKCVAAMFLFQPNRAARDYRGIRREFAGSVFQEAHSVEPYYLACFANYRFNFMVRNRRVNKDWKIYKYYALYALGADACNGADIFKMGKTTAKSVCDSIAITLSDEDSFVDHIERVCSIVERILEERGELSRAGIRDQLRLEKFGKEFIKEWNAS